LGARRAMEIYIENPRDMEEVHGEAPGARWRDLFPALFCG